MCKVWAENKGKQMTMNLSKLFIHKEIENPLRPLTLDTKYAILVYRRDITTFFDA